MKFPFFVLVICSLPTLFFAQTPTFTAQEIQEDLDYLQEALYRIHPSPFRYTSRDTLDDYFRQLRKKAAPGLSELVLDQEINELLTYVGCIHTNARRKLKKVKKGTPRAKLIPFAFFTDGDSLWTTQAIMDTFTDYQWQRILEINGHKTDTILQELMLYHASDGYNTTFMTRLLSRGANFGKLYHNYFGTDSLVRFSFETDEQDTLSIDIPKLTPKRRPASSETKEKPQWTLEVKNHFYREEENWALLKLNSFNPYKRKTRKFYKDLFRQLQEKQIPNLVIDVRDNLGGSISDANMVLRHILDEDFVILLERNKAPTFKYSSFGSKINFVFFSLKRSLELRKKYTMDGKKVAEFKTRVSRKNNFDGRVFVITNGYSASSSSYLATLLKYKEKATVIGEESGGGAAGNNGLYYTTVHLPNSKIRVRIPFYWLNYQLIPDKGRGVLPDVQLDYDIQALKAQKDLEMDWLKKQIEPIKADR